VSKLFAGLLGFAILPLYLIATIFIGWTSRRRVTGSNDFLNASRSLPLWVVAAAFLSSNCGALEIVGLSAVAAQYGVQALHFYWLGAIPGMVFLGGVMVPVYIRSGVKSLPEYLEKRFDARVRLLNSWLILATVTALSGVGLYAMAEVLLVVFGWPFSASALLAAGVVLIYLLLGGLRATIYNEVFQLLVIFMGLLPLAFRVRISVPGVASDLSSRSHLWLALPAVSRAADFDKFGVIVGLGFVLSFNYWCTDFVQIQRALTSRSINSGRMVPLLAGFGKLGFSLLVVTPALGAAAFLGHRMPGSFDQTLPALMSVSYTPALLGLGMTALLASLMSGLAANVSAFSAVWTEEIYRKSIRPGETEEHYIQIGRRAIQVGIALSLATSHVAFNFRDLMELVQLIFSLFGAPFFAVFLIGIFTRKATASGAMSGLVSGVLVAATFHGLVASGHVRFGSQMSANFYSAVCAFLASLAAGLLFSNKSERRSELELANLVYKSTHSDRLPRASANWWILACLLITTCAFLNYLWR
jgi:solute:Na+ symporter, SSS family